MRRSIKAPAETQADGNSAIPDEQTSGWLVALVAEAFDDTPAKLVDKIARMAAPPRGGESDPTRETILSYAKEPTSTVVKGKTVTRRNRLTPLHYKFAHLVINYLDGRRPGPEHIDVPTKVTESAAWQDARKICKQVLRDERERRYERLLGSDSGTEAMISSLSGIYALCRRESSDKKYHQELLILGNSGTKKAPRCHCTLVTEKIVTRGEWMLVGNIVHCVVSGFREDNSHDIGGLYLAHSAGHDLLPGFLAGAGTDAKDPVAMPLVAVKLLDANVNMVHLGDLGDEAILRAFRNVQADLTTITDSLEKILEAQMKPVLFHAVDCNPELRKVFDAGRSLVHPRFREFIRSTVR
jgi:hypothetical protein